MSATRSRASAALALLLLGAACGDPAPFPPEHWIARLGSEDAAKREEAIENLGRLGRQDPDKVGALLVGLLERRGQQVVIGVRVEPDFTGLTPAEAERLLEPIALRVRGRLQLAGGTVSKVVAEKGAIEAFVGRPAGAKDLAEAQALVLAEAARAGTIDLRVELPPPAPPTAERPVSPFPGDLAAYTAWRAEETARLEAAPADYRPSVAGRRLLPRAPGEAAAAEGTGPVPVLDPDGPEGTFTEADLLFLPGDDLGLPALRVSATPPRAADFTAFLRAHAGLRLWLVVDGRAELSARIPPQAAADVVFRVHVPDPAVGRTRAAEITALAALGRHPVPVRATLIPRAPLIAPDNPLAKAIVAIGPAVEPRLEALAAKDPSWGPLVQALKDGILKGRTRR